MQGLGFRVWDSGCRVQDVRFSFVCCKGRLGIRV